MKRGINERNETKLASIRSQFVDMCNIECKRKKEKVRKVVVRLKKIKIKNNFKFLFSNQQEIDYTT